MFDKIIFCLGGRFTPSAAYGTGSCFKVVKLPSSVLEISGAGPHGDSNVVIV